MSTPLDTLSAAAALVGSLGLHPADASPEHHAHPGALQALREAQVELYCDHDAAALTALREARRALTGDAASEAEAMASLEEAAWHIRRHEMREAQAAIGQARGRLA